MLPSFIKTPLIQSIPLSELLGKNVYLKLEMLQPSGSFKDRGIGHLCDVLAKEGSRGFVCSSGGNAGMAAAYAGKRLNLPVHIFVPNSTSSEMIKKLHTTEAHIVLHGESWDETDEQARQEAKNLDFSYIPPFDHPLIWEGYEKIIEEIYEQGIKPDAFVLAVGGGGLLTGLIQGLKKSKSNPSQTAILTAETRGAASLALSLEQSKHITLDKISTVATTLGAKRVAAQAFKEASNYPVQPQIVSDEDAIRACIRFSEQHKLLVEPACGAALSVIYQPSEIFDKYKNICVIICGGNGVSPKLLEKWANQFSINT